MPEQLDVVRGHARIARPEASGGASLQLSLCVEDPDTLAALTQHAEGDERERFALAALRIGVLALRQARGQIDGAQIRHESERLLDALDQKLKAHSDQLHGRLTGALKDYFDPDSGRFPERVNRLLREDGELEQVLRRQVGADGSELAKTLEAFVGEQSPLLKLLSPDESRGLLKALGETLAAQLQQQREAIFRQFSLDLPESALSRLVAELGKSHTELTGELHHKIDEVVGEFSLDDENSALSRLVKNVDRAQKTITSEFSLDEEASALSRLKKILESTQAAIDGNLTLDRDDSALARLRKEVLDILDKHSQTNQSFQAEVKLTLEKMAVRRAEAARSTRHGDDFERAVCEFLVVEAQKLGDIATPTGTTPGSLNNRKVGDCVIELGPDCATPGAKLVVEITQEAKYHVSKAREELEVARKNRGAQVGLYVYSQKVMPTELSVTPLVRYGSDIVVFWNQDDPATDVYLQSGFLVARALCIRENKSTDHRHADFQAIDGAINEIETSLDSLTEIETSGKTIQKGAIKILKEVETSREKLVRQLKILRERMTDIRQIEPAQ